VLDASATFRGGAVADLDVDLGRSLDLFVDEAAALRALALWRSYAAVFAAPRAAESRASGVALDRVHVSKLRARLSVRWSSEESERERAARERAGELAPSASSPDLAAADAPSVPRQLLDVFAAVERSRVTLPALDLEERLDVATLGALAGAHYQRGAARNALEIAGSLRALGNPLGLARGVLRGLEDAVREPLLGLLAAIDDDAPEAFALGVERGSKRERNSQLQRLLSRPFSTRFG
jgi:hypothetical protein